MQFRPRLRFTRNRRGISTPVLLMCVMAALLFIVMAVDLAQLSLQRKQMQNGADAATVAAVSPLMDRRWLYLGTEGSSGNEHMFNALPEMQQDDAFVEAQTFCGSNLVAGKPIELEAAAVKFGYVAQPGDGDHAMAPATEEYAANTISIELTRSKLGGNPPVLWLAKQTGLENVDVVVRSQASVATRIYGFQPLPRVNVPIVPLGLFKHRENSGSSSADESSSSSPGELAHLWWAKGPNDQFTVDTQRGMFGSGEDGIAEMKFRIRQEGSSSSDSSHDDVRPAALMGFHEYHLNIDVFSRMAAIGAHEVDFARYGGSITLDDDNPALCPARFSLPTDELSGLHSVLCHPEFKAQPRIWPIVANCSSVTGKPTVGIIGFVAGSVAHCEYDSGDDSLIVHIQPCLIQTPTALTDGSVRQNPWIGKLLLVR